MDVRNALITYTPLEAHHMNVDCTSPTLLSDCASGQVPQCVDRSQLCDHNYSVASFIQIHIALYHIKRVRPESFKYEFPLAKQRHVRFPCLHIYDPRFLSLASENDISNLDTNTVERQLVEPRVYNLCKYKDSFQDEDWILLYRCAILGTAFCIAAPS